MKYKIEWMENKTTSTGKKMIKASISPENSSTIIEDVAIWDSFPNFEGLAPGAEVEGDLVEKQNGNYTNRSLYAPKPAGGANRGGFKTQVIKEAQDVKRKDIAEAQENRGQGVRISATMRDAVLIATTLAQGGIQDESVLKGKVLEIRQWLWQHWDDPESYPPF